MLHSVNPFVDRIPAEDKKAYLDDLMYQLVQRSYEDSRTGRVYVPHQLLVAYARK